MDFDGVANFSIVYENGDRCLYIDGERRDYDDVLKLDDIDGIDDYYIDDRLFNGNSLYYKDFVEKFKKEHIGFWGCFINNIIDIQDTYVIIEEGDIKMKIDSTGICVSGTDFYLEYGKRPLMIDGLKYTGIASSYYTTDEEHIVTVALTPALVKKIETLYRDNELICKIDFYGIALDEKLTSSNIADFHIPLNDWHIKFKIINTDIFDGEPQVDYDNGLLSFHYVLKDEYIFKPLKIKGF